jgi:hypothetical protein
MMEKTRKTMNVDTVMGTVTNMIALITMSTSTRVVTG